MLAILRKDTREFLGCAGFHNPKSKTPEFGIWIKKTSHGNGYGKEAITALYDWVCGKFEFDYILYPVDKRNIASRKIPESLGGVIKKEYKEKNLVGFELDEVEYHIFPKKFLSYRNFAIKGEKQIHLRWMSLQRPILTKFHWWLNDGNE